jgi:hypothetical protein
MSIQLTVSSINEVDADLQKYVTESDGKFVFDNEQFKKGLIAERDNSAKLKTELNEFKSLGMSVEQIKAFAALGKTPAEISDAIAKGAANAPGNDSGVSKTEWLEMQKELTAMREFKAMYEAERGKVRAATKSKMVRDLVRNMADEFDKERLERLAEEMLADKFELNDAGDALNAIGEKLPADYLADFANAYGFKKTSTAGNANPGNANFGKGEKSAAFAAAKESGDVDGAIANAPIID